MFPTKKDSLVSELNQKEWFVIIESQQEGPYCLLELKKDPRFTPDTLVWKKGFQEWKPARFVPEMQEIFKDERESQALHEPEKNNVIEPDLGQHPQVTLTLQQDPYQFLLWILLLILLLFTFYQFYHNQL